MYKLVSLLFAALAIQGVIALQGQPDPIECELLPQIILTRLPDGGSTYFPSPRWQRPTSRSI